MAKLKKLTQFLDRLDEADIHYTLSSVREDSVLVAANAPGERWEIEFQSDGDVEVEVFHSDGEIRDLSATAGLFETAAKGQ